MGGLYINVDPRGGTIDVDGGVGLSFNNGAGFDREDVLDLDAAERAWTRLEDAVDHVEKEGVTQDGHWYVCYLMYDTSGFGYWMGDGFFGFTPTCRFEKPKNLELTDIDLNDIENKFHDVMAMGETALLQNVDELEKQVNGRIDVEPAWY